MPSINKKLQNCIDRVDGVFENYSEGKLTEIGLIDFLDQEIRQFTKRNITWSHLALEDYFGPQFNASDRVLMMYSDCRFNNLDCITKGKEGKFE